MGSGQKAPPPPDYTPIANASKEISKESLALGREQLQWAKDQFAQNKEITDQVVASFLKQQALNEENAIKDRKRYEEIYQPLEDSLAKEAADYASPERKLKEMGRATADVAQRFDAARKSAQRDLESYGIDPSSTRYAALDIGARAQNAAAQAAAATQASDRVDAIGRALRSEAINVGRGYPGQIAGAYNTATQGGTGASGTTLNQTSTGSRTMNAPQGWWGQANNALGVWGNALNQGYQNQLAAWNANQNSSSGWGSALGLMGGLLMADKGGVVPAYAEGGGAIWGMNDRAAPTDVAGGVTPQGNPSYAGGAGPVGNSAYEAPGVPNGIPGPAIPVGAPDYTSDAFTGGQTAGGIPLGAPPSAAISPSGLPVYTAPVQNGIPQPDGGAVPQQVSPSGGMAPDDVPSKLSAGEFIMPKAAVDWHGQKYMYNLIKKAQEGAPQAKKTTGAVPKMTPVGKTGGGTAPLPPPAVQGGLPWAAPPSYNVGALPPAAINPALFNQYGGA